MKNKFKITRADYLKAMRKARREEEIREHLHPVNINRVHTSRKVYNRKRSKADLNKDLPYFLYKIPLLQEFFFNCSKRSSIVFASATTSPSQHILNPEVVRSPVSTYIPDTTLRFARIPLRCNAFRTIAYF